MKLFNKIITGLGMGILFTLMLAFYIAMSAMPFVGAYFIIRYIVS